MGKQKYPQASSATADGEVTRSGRSDYSNLKAKARKDRRRQEAAARQRDYDKLTVPQKIARAKSRPGESKKELAKLNTPRLNANNNPR